MSVNNIIANTRQSYLPHTDKLPKIAVDYIWNNLLKDEEDDVKKMFFIIRKSQEINLAKREGRTPIPYELIRKEKLEDAIKTLKELGVVQYSNFSKNAKRSREYWIDWDLYRHIETLIPGRVRDFSKNNWQLWNGISNTALRSSSKRSRHDIYKYNRRKKKDELIVSDIVADGILPIRYCVIDFINVEDYLNYYRELYMKKVLTVSGELKYLNNERCYRNILLSGFEAKDNLLMYKPTYRGQKSGRKSEIGGGFQSCSREMKHEAFYFIPNVRNYDLKSSQMYALKYAFMSARFNTAVVDRYFTIDKAVWASQIGVDKDTWKGLMYGTYYGGLPTTIFKKDGTIKNMKAPGLLKLEVVRNHICKYLGIKSWYNDIKFEYECINPSINVSKIKAILQAFYQQNKELIKELKNWRDFLATDYLESNVDRSSSKGDLIIWNRSRMPIEMSQYINARGIVNSEGKRKLASHLLQGQEAQFISCITKYSLQDKDCPYRVMNDQHDGVIVQGFIPDEYQEKARRETKFKMAYLEHKGYI